MYFVYILESADQQRWYVGITDDIDRRLTEHNSGHSTHTEKFRPWGIKTYVAFSKLNRAQAFERYLKSHSGRAFAKKRL
jgi:predicted GIY-YIG superfamily endonuclease